MPPAPKIAVDTMLGGLARWLRLLGLDTVYPAGPPQPPLPNRILVTRRSTRPHQPSLESWDRVLRITADRTQDQLLETVRALGISRDDIEPLTRCNLCNRILEKIDKAEAAGLVPEYVLQTQETFRLCLKCGRIYWPGTHHDRMYNVMEALWD